MNSNKLHYSIIANENPADHQKSATFTHSQYMPQLDALRAFAVIAVIYFHFYLGGKPGGAPWGAWGVQLFFVLSGFLITGILLKCRNLEEVQDKGKRQLRQFYIRRGLRIFPLFYFVILTTALLNIYPARQTLWWHLTYTSNFYFAIQGSAMGPIAHLWSLSVEEQFYLLWPCLMLFLPDRYLLSCIVTAIIAALMYKIGGFFLGLNSIALSFMMIGCLDSLGMGALLAFCRHKYPGQFRAMERHRIYNLSGFALLVIVATLILSDSRNYFLESQIRCFRRCSSPG